MTEEEVRNQTLAEVAAVIRRRLIPSARCLAKVKVVALGSDVEDAYVRALEKAADTVESLMTRGP